MKEEEIVPSIERAECDICSKQDIPCWRLWIESACTEIYLCLDCIKIAVKALESIP